MLCTAGALHSCARECSHSDSIYLREINTVLNICHHFPNKVGLFDLFYHSMIRKRVFNHLVNLRCQLGEPIIESENMQFGVEADLVMFIDPMHCTFMKFWLSPHRLDEAYFWDFD